MVFAIAMVKSVSWQWFIHSGILLCLLFCLHGMGIVSIKNITALFTSVLVFLPFFNLQKTTDFKIVIPLLYIYIEFNNKNNNTEKDRISCLYSPSGVFRSVKYIFHLFYLSKSKHIFTGGFESIQGKRLNLKCMITFRVCRTKSKVEERMNEIVKNHCCCINTHS